MRPAQGGGRELRVGVVACDLDRTLTDRRLRVVPGALVALRRARRTGIRTVLVTGRRLPELRWRRSLLDAFDGLVLEGGALAGPLGDLRPTASDSRDIQALSGWLRARGIAHDGGQAVVTVPARHLRRLRAYPALGRFSLHANRGRVDVTVHGVDKGAGLRRALRSLPSRPAGRLLAFGDAENDLPLFAAADYRVAVANAVPALKRRADETTAAYGGWGVAGFVRRRLLEGGRGRDA